MAKINKINNASGQLTIDPGATGDSYIQLDINTTGEFKIGVDDTDDSFSISQGSALGTNDFFNMDGNGANRQASNVAFLAYLGSDATNVTGDGTAYTLVSLTEVFDQNSDFNASTGTFTAPVSGKYFFTFSVRLEDVVSQTSGYIEISTSNKNYFSGFLDPSSLVSNNDKLKYQLYILADMDASDTATFIIQEAGSTKTVDITGSEYDTYISGYLVC